MTDYPSDMDPECIPICDAMNGLSGIHTIESCCGHGERPHRIFFTAQAINCLIPVLFRCESSAWHIEVLSGINTKDFSDIVIFMLEGPIGPAEMPGGANDFAKWLGM